MKQGELSPLITEVIVPLVCAINSALVFALAGFVLAICGNYLGFIAFPSRVVFAVVAAFVLVYAWGLSLIDRTKTRMVKQLETVNCTQDDREAIRETIRLQVISEDGRQGQFVDNLPTTKRKMIILGDAIINKGMSTSVSNLCGSDKPFGRGELESLRDKFIALGWWEWVSDKNPAMGLQCTKAGRAVFSHFAQMATTAHKE